MGMSWEADALPEQANALNSHGREAVDRRIDSTKFTGNMTSQGCIINESATRFE